MSLKTDYYDGATGLNQQMDTAFAQGASFVVTNLTTLSNGLKSYASQGLTEFTINLIVAGPPNTTYLRANNGNNLLLKSYLAGITDGLAAQSIYNYECTPVLNVSDSITTSVDFKFNFNG